MSMPLSQVPHHDDGSVYFSAAGLGGRWHELMACLMVQHTNEDLTPAASIT
jgi:hypothetical protein